MTVLDEIVEARCRRLAAEGPAFGFDLPATRTLPLVQPPGGRFVIGEVKRRSPSAGEIAGGADPVERVRGYRKAGFAMVSVLTEGSYFGGSLADLSAVKTAFPGMAVLRKDFLTDPAEIDVSLRAGADAVLLLAGVLGDRFGEMYEACLAAGLTALVEVYDAGELEVIRRFAPPLVGINTRDLKTFVVDPLRPATVAEGIDWPCRLVFESGIRGAVDAEYAASAGFDALLVGESLMRTPGNAATIMEVFTADTVGSVSEFWQRVASETKPLVKVCGLTGRPDAEAAAAAGADFLGFVFADSPRRASRDAAAACVDLGLPRIGVVVPDGKPGNAAGLKDALTAVRGGDLDALQIHLVDPAQATNVPDLSGIPRFYAMGVSNEDQVREAFRLGGSRVLVDARSGGSSGGLGKRLDPALARVAAKALPLWLAGGLGPDNIRSAVMDLDPELVDASSGLESSPGKKDLGKLRAYVAGAKETR